MTMKVRLLLCTLMLALAVVAGVATEILNPTQESAGFTANANVAPAA